MNKYAPNKGGVLESQPNGIAEVLVRKGVAIYANEKDKPIEHELVQYEINEPKIVDTPKVEVIIQEEIKPKKRGNPNFGKRNK